MLTLPPRIKDDIWQHRLHVSSNSTETRSHDHFLNSSYLLQRLLSVRTNGCYWKHSNSSCRYEAATHARCEEDCGKCSFLWTECFSPQLLLLLPRNMFCFHSTDVRLFKTHQTEDTAAARPLVTVPELCVVTAALLLPLLSCVHPSASSQLPSIIFTHDNLSGGTLGQFEDLVWLYM